MILFDINILIYAHREDQENHEYYRSRLESTLSNGQTFGLTPLVIGGFLRIVTNPSFPNGPTPMPQALALMETFVQQPQFHSVGPGRRHSELLFSLCRSSACAGKNVADAQHAAIAIEHGCTWVSRDRDFHQFVNQGLRFEEWSPPN